MHPSFRGLSDQNVHVVGNGFLEATALGCCGEPRVFGGFRVALDVGYQAPEGAAGPMRVSKPCVGSLLIKEAACWLRLPVSEAEMSSGVLGSIPMH